MKKEFSISEEIQEKNQQFFSRPDEEYIANDEIYAGVSCPKCEKKNWVYCGRRDDPTTCGGDGEVCKCYHCEHAFWMMEPEFIREFHDIEFENAKGDIAVLLEKEVAYPDKGNEKPPWER